MKSASRVRAAVSFSSTAAGVQHHNSENMFDQSENKCFEAQNVESTPFKRLRDFFFLLPYIERLY